MIAAIAAAEEMQNSFDRYLDMVIAGNEVIVTKNGKEAGRFIPGQTAVSFLTDSLTDILSGSGGGEKSEKALKEKYGITD